VGAFRCHPNHPCFHDSGPATSFCFVFPRTAVEIQHEHERAFVANPNVVTFYNKGQAYLRNAISDEGDRCDWFGVCADIARDVIRSYDPAVDNRPERPFRFTRGFAQAPSYLAQRRVFNCVAGGVQKEPLEVEEAVVYLLDQVVAAVYGRRRESRTSRYAREIVHSVEKILSEHWQEGLTLDAIASEVGLSVYHLCRVFRDATGISQHQYRLRLRARRSLEMVEESEVGLVEIALENGFCTHSHFSASFRNEFGVTPSAVRAGRSRARS
jgi:AraC family transcriptional regulator